MTNCMEHDWKLASTVREPTYIGTSSEEFAYLICTRCGHVQKQKVEIV